jgi:hypothetical protein
LYSELRHSFPRSIQPITRTVSMKASSLKRIMTLIVLSSVAVGCNTDKFKDNKTQVGSAQGVPLLIQDYWNIFVVAQHVAPPAPMESFNYTDDRNFDLLLSSSMRHLAYIQVSVPTTIDASQIEQQSQRLHAWLYAVKKNGVVYTCPLGGEQAGLLAVIIQLALSGLPEIDNWLTYGPAKKFDAIVYVSKEDGKTIKKIGFIKRPNPSPPVPAGVTPSCKMLELK